MSSSISDSMKQILDRFEEAWTGPTPPQIEDYLAKVDPQRRLALLIELVRVDLEHWLAAGEQVRLCEAYLPRFPELSADSQAIFTLLKHEYNLRRRKEPDLTPAEYLKRFPELHQWLLAQPLTGLEGQEAEEAMSPTICANCGEAFLPTASHCQSCGHPFQQTLNWPNEPHSPVGTKLESIGGEGGRRLGSNQPASPTKTDSPPRDLAIKPLSNEDDTAKVEKLLGRIAAQSHFEERYEVREELARGGMGLIYSAYDRILRRQVAIKMMRHEMHGSEVAPIRGQFLKEARVGGRLLHPNILPVFDLGVNRAGQIYYTMRLVHGASLQQFLDSLDQGIATMLVSYPLRKIMEALVRACHGVDYAHQNGVIHLDLKPQNIIVSRFSEVFVIDWGLARVDEVDDTEELIDLYRNRSCGHNTGSNTGVFGARVVGTPGYMAPEQVEGDYRSFDAATDVFGLGGILHFALYGKAPNQGQSIQETLAASREQKKRGKLRSEILPRGQRVKKEVQDAIEALEAICLKALEPDKAKRYADVEKMIVELNEWLSNTPHPPLGI